MSFPQLTSTPDHAAAGARAGRGRPIRVGLIFFHVPSKQGSLEDWVLACNRAGLKRGHAVEVFTLAPILPSIQAELESCGGRWRDLSEATASPWRAMRRFSLFNVIHLNFLGPRSTVAIAAYLACPRRVIWTDHSSESPGASTRSPVWRTALDRLCLTCLGSAVGVSEFVAKRVQQRFGDSPKVTMIYNGVDIERFRPARSLDAPQPLSQDRCPHLLVAANLIRGKGIDWLLRSLVPMAATPWRLRVVGVGPEEAHLRHLTKQLHLEDRVTFLGLRSDLDCILRDTDIFIHPARWEEAFGLTVAEAMASGVAVIAGRGGALPELIQHEHSGLLVTRDDVAELTAAITRLIKQPSLRQALAQAARERAVAQFSLADCIRRYWDLYEQVAVGGFARG